MKAVSPHNEVATSEGQEQSKDLAGRKAFLPETYGKKSHHDRSKILNENGGGHLDFADGVKIGHLDQGHHHASKKEEIPEIPGSNLEKRPEPDSKNDGEEDS